MLKKIRNILLAIIGFIVLLVALIIIFTPILVEMGIEKGGTKLVGAKVEIAKLKMGFHDLSFLIKRLEVTNPNQTMRNLFEIDTIKYKMDLWQLLKGNSVIETIQITDVRVNTPRKKDGAIKKAKKENKKNKEEKSVELFNTDVFSQMKNFDYDKYINDNIKSIEKIKNFQKNSIETYKKWENDFKNVQSHNDIKKIYEDLKNINVTINNPAEFPAKYDAIMNAKNKFNNITNDFQRKKNGLTSDFNQIENNAKGIEKSIKNDFNDILKKANIKNISIKNISSLIFRDEVMKHVDTALYWSERIKKNVPKNDTKKEKTKKIKKKKAKFQIKKIIISTSNEETAIKGFPIIIGQVNNISENQDRINKPIDASLKVRVPDVTDIKSTLTAVIDRRKDNLHDKYKLNVDDIMLSGFDLMGNYGLPDKIDNSNLNLKASVDVYDESIKIAGNISLEKLNFVYNDKKYDELSSIIKSVFKGIKNISLNVAVTVKNNEPKISITSNLDKIIRQKIKDIFEKKLNELKTKIKEKYYAFIDPKKEEAFAIVNENKKKANAIFKEKENLMNAEKAKVEELLKSKTNELEERKKQLEQEAASKVEEAVDTIRDNVPKLF